MGEIYGKDSMVAICNAAAGLDNFLDSFPTLGATKSCARNTNGYIRGSGSMEGCAVPMGFERWQGSDKGPVMLSEGHECECECRQLTAQRSFF